MIYASVVYYEQKNQARHMYKCADDTVFLDWWLENNEKIYYIYVSREELPTFYDPLIPGDEEYQEIKKE